MENHPAMFQSPATSVLSQISLRYLLKKNNVYITGRSLAPPGWPYSHICQSPPPRPIAHCDLPPALGRLKPRLDDVGVMMYFITNQYDYIVTLMITHD